MRKRSFEELSPPAQELFAPLAPDAPPIPIDRRLLASLADCCGISFEYRRFALGPVRNENQFRLAFSLANIGTFGNMKQQERLF